VKVHRLDGSKTSLFCETGTVCGIRLKPVDGVYYAERVGTLQYTCQRNVVGQCGEITCQRCMKIEAGR